jgi:hypothetical protein
MARSATPARPSLSEEELATLRAALEQCRDQRTGQLSVAHDFGPTGDPVAVAHAASVKRILNDVIAALARPRRRHVRPLRLLRQADPVRAPGGAALHQRLRALPEPTGQRVVSTVLRRLNLRRRCTVAPGRSGRRPHRAEHPSGRLSPL